jgi:Xaa-Pro aminopeptidase
MTKFRLTAIQNALKDNNFDGWLFYDYCGSDPIGRKILNFSTEFGQTRRWFYFIPAENAPIKIVHSIERNVLDHLPGKKMVYLGWQEMQNSLAKILKGGMHVAAQYSPRGALPYVSRIDAGTFELLKSFKIKIRSSADLLQEFEAVWNQAQLNTHKNAAIILYDILEKAFGYIKRKITRHSQVTEYDVQKYLISELKKNGLVCDHPPIVAAGKNTADPHYIPFEENAASIYPKSLVQLNVWGKEESAHAVYAVIAWVGVVSDTVPDTYQEQFNSICLARDNTIAHIHKMMQQNKVIYGWQVDEMIRKHLIEAGFGGNILHRSGHSIGRDINDVGTNMDNLETKDQRRIIAKTCFSIEPALYFSDYGMRSEVNVYVDRHGAHMYTQPVQKHIVPILK